MPQARNSVRGSPKGLVMVFRQVRVTIGIGFFKVKSLDNILCKIAFMKKIEAIIRKTKFEEVKDALLEAGIEWFSYCDVRGVGKSRQARVYRGIMYDTSSIERTMISIVVRDKNVEKTVTAIVRAAQSGEIGDGRIFVLPVEDSVRIRTGERGDIALYNAEQEE